MIIREIETFDAEKLANLIQQVEESSPYMLWEAGERNLLAETQLKMIKDIRNAENSTLLVAEKDNELVGYLIAIGGKAQRNKHTVYLVIGISKNYRRKGIGTKLFNRVEQWAANHNISRLELTVVTKNEEALSLYKKKGFEIEGTKRNSLVINGEFVDENYMAKLL